MTTRKLEDDPAYRLGVLMEICRRNGDALNKMIAVADSGKREISSEMLQKIADDLMNTYHREQDRLNKKLVDWQTNEDFYPNGDIRPK